MARGEPAEVASRPTCFDSRLTPRGAIKFDADPLPAALTADPTTGITAAMAAQRDATGRGGSRESRAPGDSLEGSGFLDLVCQS